MTDMFEVRDDDGAEVFGPDAVVERRREDGARPVPIRLADLFDLTDNHLKEERARLRKQRDDLQAALGAVGLTWKDVRPGDHVRDSGAEGKGQDG